MSERDSMTLAEAARASGVPESVIRRDLPAYMADDQWRVPTEVIRVYLEWQRGGSLDSFEPPPARTASRTLTPSE
jgi:hypothetical protein